VSQPRVVVIGNEKGGAGKSTLAIHIASSLLAEGSRVGVIDLDLRQQSFGRFLSNRRAWLASAGVAAPMPHRYDPGEDVEGFCRAVLEALAGSDFVVIDTPGGDTHLSRAAHALADLIVTPMNDSFVDFDLLGEVDPVTLDLKKPSIYSLTVWESRKLRAQRDGRSIDWVVVSNRLAQFEARNRRRVDERVAALSRRVGFRIGPTLRDRVIYRELFPFGLTVADLSSDIRPGPISLSHVAARQELRSLMWALGLGREAAVEDEAPAA
jgi:chromosome partitioning protein